MTSAGRPADPFATEPFQPDLSEGAETGVYLALLELIDEGLIITGDEIIFDVNSAACRLLERDYRELAGRALNQLFCSEEAYLQAREQLLIRGKRRSVQRLALPDGSSRELQVVCAPRLRPGIHALILSPLATIAPAAATDAATAADSGESSALPPTDAFAAHLDPAQLRTRRYATCKSGPLAPPEAPPAPAAFDADLRSALQQRNLEVHFQPVIDARSGEIHACEALLRWHHAELGLLPFERFRDALGDNRLLTDIGDWMLQSACAAACEWPPRRPGQAAIRLSVKLASEHLATDDFAAQLQAVLDRTALPPARLELCFDEDLLTGEPDWLQTRLRTLSDLGVRLAIGDYGRSFSAVAHLRRHPLHAIRLDPTLVAGVGRSEESEALVEAITSMATILDLEVSAQGTNDAAQQAFLCALGCHLQQGPLFGAPMPAAEFICHLNSRAAVWRTASSSGP